MWAAPWSAQVECGLLSEPDAEECIGVEFNPVRAGFAGGADVWTRDVLNLGVRPDRIIATVCWVLGFFFVSNSVGLGVRFWLGVQRVRSTPIIAPLNRTISTILPGDMHACSCEEARRACWVADEKRCN